MNRGEKYIVTRWHRSARMIQPEEEPYTDVMDNRGEAEGVALACGGMVYRLVDPDAMVIEGDVSDFVRDYGRTGTD